MSFFGFGRKNENANIPGYAKFKMNARRFVNAYYNSPKNQTKNINAALVANAHAFLNANPRQAARAGNAAGAAAAAGANQNVQANVAGAVLATPPGSPVAAANNAAAAALNAGATVPQAAAAAEAAAAPPPPPPLPPRKPLPRTQNVNLLTGNAPPSSSENPIARAAANSAAAMRTAKINRLIANLSNSSKKTNARASLNGYLSPNSNINNATRQRIRNALNAPPAQLPNIFSGNAGGPPPALNARINAFNKVIKEIQNANLNTANVANLNKRLNAARNALRNSGLSSWNVGRQANYAAWRGAINAAKNKRPKN